MKSNKNNYRFWHSPIALALLFLLVVLFGYKIIFLIEKQRETSHKKEVFLNEINELKKKEASLLLDMKKLETDEGKEEVIRSKYQVIKDGEKMVTIVDEEEKVNSTTESDNTNHGFWNWLKNFFNK